MGIGLVLGFQGLVQGLKPLLDAVLPAAGFRIGFRISRALERLNPLLGAVLPAGERRGAGLPARGLGVALCAIAAAGDQR